jgi:DNA-directed RNA polymerase specialized sigma24 family protein
MNPLPRSADSPEARFGVIFAHFDALVSYAGRRGSGDPEGIAAETMAIAWRRLSSVPADDPRPWLFVTARHLVMAELRRSRQQHELGETAAGAGVPPPVDTTDPLVTLALRSLSAGDREVLLLVGWDDLTPAQGAEVLGITGVAFRVRLLRARRRFGQLMDRTRTAGDQAQIVEMESA